MTARENERTINPMRKPKLPEPDRREWQCVDTTGEEAPRPTWFKINAVQIRDTLNTRDEGRYKVEKRKAAT